MRGVPFWTGVLLVIGAAVGWSPRLLAQQDSTSLQARVNDLEQQVRILQR
jgi:hypothetical protein